MQRVLAQIGSATADRDAHGKSALRIVENDPVLAAVLRREPFDFPLCELHDFPLLLRVRSGSADPQRTPQDDAV